jgi:opacity protein-like surface antigen
MSAAYNFGHLAVAQMSILERSLTFTLVLAALCLGQRTAHAQATAVPYYMADWPIGFGGALSSDENANGAYRYKFPNGFFVGGQSGGMGLNTYGINRSTAFGNLGSLSYEGMKFGYDFKNAPLTVFGGIDTFKYNIGPGPSSPFAAFENTSGTMPGYGVNAGVEFRPTSNLSLSLGVGYVDQSSGRVDSDIRSPLLPGQTPLAIGGRRY